MLTQITSPAGASLLPSSAQGGKASVSSGQGKNASSASHANDLGTTLAHRKKQNASEDIERLKKQMTDVAILSLVNPKGAARIYAEMGKKLENAARDYTEGAHEIEQQSKATSTGSTPAQIAPEAAIAVDANASITPPTPPDAAVSPTETARAMAEESALHAADRAQRLQQYAATASATSDDKTVLATIKSLGHTLEEQFRLALQMAEEQDSSEENKQDLEQLQSDFANSRAAWRDSAETLDQIALRADSAAAKDLAVGPVSLVV